MPIRSDFARNPVRQSDGEPLNISQRSLMPFSSKTPVGGRQSEQPSGYAG